MRTDLVVVTEPGPGFRGRHPMSHMSPEERPGSDGEEAWVAILGSSLETVDLDISYRHLAVASRAVVGETRVLLYGSVLPWLSAGTHAPDVYGESKRPFIEIFETALDEQVADMKELRRQYPDDALVWAGDFNHTLTGPTLSGRASEMLERAVERLGMKATNAAAPHRRAGMNALDFICVERAWKCVAVESGYPLFGGRPLSDHRSYVSQLST